VWFWQRMVTPHMAGLAVELARRGVVVSYVAEQPMSAERARQGWESPRLTGVQLHLASSAEMINILVCAAPRDSIHICEGVRGNGLIGGAQKELLARELPQWIVMETVDDSGCLGILKRLVYRQLFSKLERQLRGVLAIGHRTAEWVSANGIPSNRVFPFAYFLQDHISSNQGRLRDEGPFRFIFAGRLISLKRVDWLVNALGDLENQKFELWIVGSGSDECVLRKLAASLLGDRVRWLGQLGLPAVPKTLAQADCLVLPSLYDGWGAVASEALMVGTPVVCSDTCGVAGAVMASGAGGIFPVNDIRILTQLLGQQLAQGVVQDEARLQLREWANCLGAKAGAKYLQEVLTYRSNFHRYLPVAPWLEARIQY
jgi:glycosyltransferase involved in cell wall biosynthesis